MLIARMLVSDVRTTWRSACAYAHHLGAHCVVSCTSTTLCDWCTCRAVDLEVGHLRQRRWVSMIRMMHSRIRSRYAVEALCRCCWEHAHILQGVLSPCRTCKPTLQEMFLSCVVHMRAYACSSVTYTVFCVKSMMLSLPICRRRPCAPLTIPAAAGSRAAAWGGARPTMGRGRRGRRHAMANLHEPAAASSVSVKCWETSCLYSTADVFGGAAEARGRGAGARGRGAGARGRGAQAQG